MPGFGPELLSTFNAVSQIASRLLPLINHVPDSLGKWVPPLKKVSAAFEKQAAAMGLASAGANVLRGRLGVVGATVAGMNTRTLGASRAWSVLAGVGAFAASRIIGGMRQGARETHRLADAASKASHEIKGIAGGGAGGGGGNILTGSVGKLLALAAAAKGALNIGERFKAAFDLGSHLQDLSDKTGIAADQILILDQAGKDNGIEDLSHSVAKMQHNLVEVVRTGAGPAAEAIEMLGLNAKDLAKAVPSDAISTIGAKIAGLENPALRTATAMALFGKSGAELLPLFRDSSALGTAAASLGRQATILKENASRFDAVSDRLNRFGLKLQGFFVGMAAGALPLIEGLTKKFDQLDLASQGERFGAAIRSAASYLAGSFASPEALASLLGNSLMAAFATAGNFLWNALANVADNFGPRLTESVVKTANSINEVFKSLLDSVLHPDGKKLADTIIKIGTQLKPSAMGNVDFFNAAGFADAARAAAVRLKAAGEPLVNEIESFGANMQKSVEQTAKQLGSLSNSGGLRGGSLAMSAGDFATRFSPGFGSQVVFSNGTTRETSALASRAAFARSPLLSAAERSSLTDAAVANGRTRQGSTAAAFGAVRAGDRARRQEVERQEQRQKLGLDKTNSLLGDLYKLTDDVWNKGGES